MKKLKQEIINMVNSNPGIKAIDLCILPNIILLCHDAVIFNKAIEELIKEKKIVEVEYILKGMSYRIKSIFFPEETEISIRS